MKIIRVSDLVPVKCPRGGFESSRFLLESDGMGFTLTHTFIPRGEPQHWHYKEHFEACYCVSGSGLLTNLGNDVVHFIEPGTVYALDRHDDHTFQAIRDTVLVCVFNPPLKGREVHREDGSYEG